MIRHLSHLLRSVARLILAALLFAPLALQTRAQNLPNLAPLNVSLSAYSARPGDLISVSFTMTNSGSANCPASFTRFYLNQFPGTVPSGDPLFEYGTPGISAGASVRQTN